MSGRYYGDPVDYTIEAMQKEIDELHVKLYILREALSHDREVCGQENNLCWMCRALKETP